MDNQPPPGCGQPPLPSSVLHPDRPNLGGPPRSRFQGIFYQGGGSQPRRGEAVVKSRDGEAGPTCPSDRGEAVDAGGGAPPPFLSCICPKGTVKISFSYSLLITRTRGKRQLAHYVGTP